MMVWPQSMGVALPAGGGSYSSGRPRQEWPDSCAYSQDDPAPPAQFPPPIVTCPHPSGFGLWAPWDTVPEVSRHTLQDESQVLFWAVTSKLFNHTLPLVAARNRSDPCWRKERMVVCCAAVGVNPIGHTVSERRSADAWISWCSA